MLIYARGLFRHCAIFQHAAVKDADAEPRISRADAGPGHRTGRPLQRDSLRRPLYALTGRIATFTIAYTCSVYAAFFMSLFTMKIATAEGQPRQT